MASFLYEIQAVVKDFLQSDEYFRDMEIITEDAVSIEDAVESAVVNDALGKKKGLVILIQMLSGTVTTPDSPGVDFRPAQIVFDVFENVSLNRAAGGNTKKGLIVAETILAVMAEFKSSEIPTHFWADRDAVDRFDLPEWGIVAHRVRMNCQGGVKDNTQVVATPVWTQDGDTLALSVATAGADIYWSRDARPFFGGAGNAANVGELYSAPFQFDGPHTYFARAYKAGMRASLLAIFDASQMAAFLTVPAGSPLLGTPAGDLLVTPP